MRGGAFLNGKEGRVGFRKRIRKNNIIKVALITGITGQDGSYLAELSYHKVYGKKSICKWMLRLTPLRAC